MKAILVVLFWSLSICGFSQFSSKVWHHGWLVVKKGDTLEGQIKYNMEVETIQFLKSDKIRAFSPKKVTYFRIFDNITENFRQFYTIPYALRGNYKTPTIFELLYEGKLSFLRREAIVQETVSSIYSQPIVTTKVKYTFYFVDDKGYIQYFSGRKSDLFSIMGKNRSELKDYIKSNKLKVNKVQDLITITAFYNSI